MKNKKLFKKIIHLVVPHEENNNVPHILRAEAVFVILVFVGILFYFNQNNFKIIKKLNLTATVYPAVLADLANKDRLNSGVSELVWSKTLEKAAKLKAEDMAQGGYFAHTSPTGITPWHWLEDVKYNFLYAGENLAVDFSESENVEQAWLNSPKHKENIMNQNFTEIGIATAEGIYNGKSTTFVVEFFGKPLKYTESGEPNKADGLAVVEEKIKTEGNVAGVSTKNLPKEIEKIETPKNISDIKIIEETDKLIIAKNDAVKNEIVEELPSANAIAQDDVNKKGSIKISTWYDRFIVNPTNTILSTYIIILGLVLTATILMLKKAYQKHHEKHLIFGFVLIFLIIILVYIIYAGNASLGI